MSSGVPSINPLYNIINYTGNYFTQTTNQSFKTCEICNAALTSITTTTTTTLSQQSYNVKYTVTKSVDCSKVVGRILVNGVILYNMSSGLPAGNYSGNFTVNDGDILTLDFSTVTPSPSCSPLVPDITIFDNNGIISEYAKYGTPNQTIYSSYTVDSNWLGNVLVINTDIQ